MKLCKFRKKKLKFQSMKYVIYGKSIYKKIKVIKVEFWIAKKTQHKRKFLNN